MYVSTFLYQWSDRKFWHYYTRRKGNSDLFIFNSNITHFQSTNIVRLWFEVLDLDFDKQTCAVNSKSKAPIFRYICGYCCGYCCALLLFCRKFVIWKFISGGRVNLVYLLFISIAVHMLIEIYKKQWKLIFLNFWHKFF